MNREAFLKRQFAAGGPPVTWWISQYLAGHVAYYFCRWGVSANMTTLLALLVSLSGLLFYGLAPAGVASAVISLIILQFGYVLDCADGQVARATKTSSEQGAWFDNLADITITCALGYVCFYQLWSADLPVMLVAAALWIFMLGHGILHFTSTRVRSSTDERIQTSGFLSIVRQLGTGVFDKPALLFWVCLFRDFPVALALMLLLAGFGYTAHAMYSGRRLLV
jgi:phosphatidylglycerophosphate synthase